MMSDVVVPFDGEFLHMTLQPICKQPLTNMYRAVGQVFEFGSQKPATNRKGEAITQGDFRLKFIYSDWRIIQNGRIILGSTDQGGDAWFYDSQELPRQPYDVEARRMALEFIAAVKAGTHKVQSVEVGPFADVSIRLSDDLIIQSFGSSGEDHDLWWFHNLLTDVSCLVGPSGHNLGPTTKP